MRWWPTCLGWSIAYQRFYYYFLSVVHLFFPLLQVRYVIMCFNRVSPFFFLFQIYMICMSKCFSLNFQMILLSYDLIGNFMNNGQASHFFLDIQLLKSWELWVGYQLALNTLSPCICLHVILVYKYHKSSNELYTMYPSSQVSTSPLPPTFFFFFCVFLYGNWDIVDCVCNHQCPGFFCFALTYLLDNIITMQETSFFSSKLQCTISRSNLHVVCVKSLLSFIQTFCIQLSHFWLLFVSVCDLHQLCKFYYSCNIELFFTQMLHGINKK